MSLIPRIAFGIFILSVLTAQELPRQAGSTKQRGTISAESMQCDGGTDDTAAFNALVSSAVGLGPARVRTELHTIVLPVGKCRFASAPKPIPAGIKIVGSGNTESTWLVADYDEPNDKNGFLTWNTLFPQPGSGLGGGLQHVHISKGSGKTGGSAIKIAGSDDLHRPGFMVFDDLYINSAYGSPGYWHHFVFIDGSCCITQGSNGIRDIIFTNFHFGQSSPPTEGDSILIFNGVHVFLTNGLIFTSHHGGLHITGLDKADNHSSHDILMSNLNIEGALVIENAQGITFSGWIAGKLITKSGVRNCFVSGILEASISNEGHCTLVSDQGVSLSGALSLTSTDAAGTLTLSNGTALYRFRKSFTMPPICTASDNDQPAPVRVTVSPTELSIAGQGDHNVSYICVARE